MKKILACLVVLLIGSTVNAAPMLIGADPTKSNGDFISGTGIPSGNFMVDTAPTGESVGLKARSRDTGEPLSISGNTFFLSPGLAADATNPWWSFDYQFSPGETGGNPDEYILTLEVDFDPTAGTNFVTISLPVGNGAGTWQATDGFFVNPLGGAWNTNSVPYGVSQSWHLAFGFWGLPYDPNANGNYRINLSVSRNGDPVASTTIFAQVGAAQVVPEPGSLALFGAAIAAAVGATVCRRRQPAV